ncbi:MAG: gamma-glutamyl-gamma-aminobutyrate hydrolase family protein [Bradymonadia bacterium]
MPSPLIGVTLDIEPPGGFSQKPWYAIRVNYAAAVAAAGGLPVMLPHDVDQVDAYLDRLDGVIISGGAFDLDPALFGAETRHPTVTTKTTRTDFEWALCRGALDRAMPVLGICGGLQLMNVALGGTLIQHIPDEIDDALAHEQPNPRDEPGHAVEIVPETLLHQLVGRARLDVNSAHHQAPGQVAPGAIVSARAPDGVIEAIEWPEHRWCLGVQWHPEYLISSAEAAIFRGLVRAAAGIEQDLTDDQGR